MEKINILLNGVEKEVYGLLYVYNSKYYFIYTEKEVDENGYVLLYMTQVGKEIINTQNGPVETGYMVGVEINDPVEQQSIQTSISYIVEDKKNNTSNPAIQYLSLNQLPKLKIASQKRFRLLKNIMVDNFKLEFNDVNVAINDQPKLPIEPVIPTPVLEVPEGVNEAEQSVETNPIEPVIPTPVLEVPKDINEVEPTSLTNENDLNENVIIDYRTKYFEEQEKNKELQEQITLLTEKINEIKKVIE